MVLGYILAIVAGCVLGSAFSGAPGSTWTVAVLAIALSVLSVLSAVWRQRPVTGEGAEQPGWNPDAAPPLGQMLVSYGLISDSDLDKALKVHRKTKKRLGKTCAEMGLISYAQLAEVLEEQVSRRESRLLWGAGEQLVG
jgi:hypothetical protein